MKNGITSAGWYSFGAASSMLAMWGLDTQQNPTYSRFPESFTLFTVGWLFWFILNFCTFTATHALIKAVFSRVVKKRIYLMPLLFGLCFGPAFYTLASLKKDSIIMPAAFFPAALACITLVWLPKGKTKAEPDSTGQPISPAQ